MDLWKFKPGNLVEWNNQWHFICKTMWLSGTCVLVKEDGSTEYHDDYRGIDDGPFCKPLLPTVNTVDEAWSALETFMQHGYSPSFPEGWLQKYLEAGRLSINRQTFPTLAYELLSYGNEKNYQSRKSDLQKEGALRQWLSQVGGQS